MPAVPYQGSKRADEKLRRKKNIYIYICGKKKCSQAYAENRYKCTHIKNILNSMTQHRELCCIQLPVLLAFTAWRLMRSISSVIDCQRSGSSPPVTVTGLIWDSCTSLPKGAGRPQWLQLMICGKYLMLARWSGDILDTQPWIMDPSRDEARAEVSKAPNEFPRWLPRTFPKRGNTIEGLTWPSLKKLLKMNIVMLS